MTSPNRDLGPCVVVWDGAGVTPVVFHKSFGGVFFRYEELQVPIKRDQAGETSTSAVTTGAVNPEVEVPLTQEECSRLDHCFADSTPGVTGGQKFLKVRNPVGVDILPFAKQLIVKPISNGVVSLLSGEWLYLHKAFPRITMAQAYDNSGQRTVKVIFTGYPDVQSGRTREMWRYGPD